MALGLDKVNENYSEKSKQYDLRSRTDKKDQTVTPWQDFSDEPDLLEMISRREGGVTKRVARSDYKKQKSPTRESSNCIMTDAISKMNQKEKYSESSLARAIKEKAKKCLSCIPRPL